MNLQCLILFSPSSDGALPPVYLDGHLVVPVLLLTGSGLPRPAVGVDPGPTPPWPCSAHLIQSAPIPLSQSYSVDFHPALTLQITELRQPMLISKQR